MKTDGKDIADWGLRVIKYEGLLNLPPRKEPTAYEWVDVMQPLTDAEDIRFNANIFSIELFYSQALIQEQELRGSALEGLLEYLYPLIKDKVKLETPYKNTRAQLKEIKEIGSFQGGRTGRFVLEFEEQRQAPYSYPEGLLKIDQVGLSIDHYHVEENFSLILEFFQEDGPRFKNNLTGVYQEQTWALKEERQVYLKLSGVYPSLDVMMKKIETFKALLACPGMRVISYKGYEYYSYLTSGIRVKIHRERIAQLEFSLKVDGKIKNCHAHL